MSNLAESLLSKRQIMSRYLAIIAFYLSIFTSVVIGQETGAIKPQPSAPAESKKANQRAAVPAPAEPFDKADVKTMEAQCVKLETEAGIIQAEMFPETAPETVRNFLNLVATGFYDTTTFSRTVPNFVVQGGNLATSQKMTPEFVKRARRTIPDEPNQVRHERGILSMARSEEPNTATTHFFILLSSAPNLDGSFAAFGRVTSGLEVVEAINKMPVDGDKPLKPIRLTKATVASCPAPAQN